MVKPKMKKLNLISIFLTVIMGNCSLSLPPSYHDLDGDSVNCSTDQIFCNGTCISIWDPNLCELCEVHCREDQVCQYTQQGPKCVCPEGKTECSGKCTDTNSDPKNCGYCGNSCAENYVCNNGACTSGCGENLTDCGGSCVDTNSNPLHCGGCFQECSSAEGADPVCENSICKLQCKTGRWDIDGIPGCEYECSFTSAIEFCNGMDDNCNGQIDETFNCIAGSEVECTTTCGSIGSGICTTDCKIPEPSSCNPPDEICNGIDDNCNGIVDEGCGTTVPNDTCLSPTNVASGGRFEGNTEAAADNSNGTCSLVHGGKDVYFTFTLTQYSDVFVSSFGSNFDTILYAGRTCGGSDLGCVDDSPGLTRQGFLRLENLSPGTYYVTLDGKNPADAGNYVLDIYISPHDDLADRCGRVSRLTITGETGSTCGYDNDFPSRCGNSSNSVPDKVFFFVIPPSAGISMHTFSTCNESTNFDTILSIRRVCNDPSSEIDCNDDDESCSVPPIPPSTHSTLSTLTVTLAPGIYYLIIKGYGNYPGECGNYYISAS